MTALDQAKAEATSVIPVDGWTVLAAVIVVFLLWSVSAWQRRNETRLTRRGRRQ